MFVKEPRSLLFFQTDIRLASEWISYRKMKCKIATEFRMYNREMLLFSVVHRIDSFHTTVKAQDKEVQIQP